MKTVLDRLGRIVVPREARERLALEPGCRLDVTVTDETIILRPLSRPQRLRIRAGVFVYCGEVLGDLSTAVSADREARMDHGRARLRR